jgi:hypothetical protein
VREAAAQRGIEQFFADSRCFATVRILRTVGDRSALELAPEEVRGLAKASQPPATRALLVTVRELGPVIKLFGSLALLEGGTEVVLDIRSVDIAAGTSTGDFQAHWQRGGPWFIRGSGSLDADMRAALAATLRLGGSS